MCGVYDDVKGSFKSREYKEGSLGRDCEEGRCSIREIWGLLESTQCLVFK